MEVKYEGKSTGHAQQFLSVHGAINSLSLQDRHLLSASAYRTLRNIGFDELNKVSGLVRVNWGKGTICRTPEGNI
jgi:hypothetical protein